MADLRCMGHYYLDAIEAAIPELQAVGRARLRSVLEDWCDAQQAEGDLPPVDRAVGELRRGLGLPEVPYNGPIVEPSSQRGQRSVNFNDEPESGRTRPRNLMAVGSSLVAVGVAFSWWNASPAFTLDAMSVDGDSIEVLWVESDQPSRVVRCSPGNLTVTARISADTEATIRNVVLPHLDGAWTDDGSVERTLAEASPVGSENFYPIIGYEVGGQANTDHDIRLVYRIDDCDSIETMAVGSALSVEYEFHGRDREAAIMLPERLAFIDEDCAVDDIASGDCPS